MREYIAIAIVAVASAIFIGTVAGINFSWGNQNNDTIDPSPTPTLPTPTPTSPTPAPTSPTPSPTPTDTPSQPIDDTPTPSPSPDRSPPEDESIPALW